MIRTLDLFCGGGGSSYGASKAGASIIGGIDLCPIATATYAQNFPTAQTFNCRIEHISPSAVARQLGTIDLLLASPECTNHSCARGARPRIEESRETALQVIRFATVLKPRWIIIENVINMRPWPRYLEMIKKLNGLGYKTTEHIIDSSDFGVPQRRRRLFVLCDRKAPPPLEIKKRPGPKPAARRILDDAETWPTKPLRLASRAKATLLRAEKAFETLGRRQPFLIVYYGSDGAGGWQPLDQPLRTITTLDRFGLVEPRPDGHTLRMLQVPELARAMGFDTNFKFNSGTRRDRIRLIGNGVCPPVMTAVVKALCGK